MFKKIAPFALPIIISLAFLNLAFGADIKGTLPAGCDQGHTPDTQTLITFVEHDATLKGMLIQSIEQARTINPDIVSNPAQSLEEFYSFIDWATKAMPFNILPSAETYPKLYESIDQSLDYFYFIADQPLECLENKGYYHNSIQYVEPYRSWMIAFTKRWGEFLSTPESWNEAFYQKALADDRFCLNKGWYESPDNWSSFNDFFSRKLSSPAVRPIAEPTNVAVVVSPADSTPEGVWQIDENSMIVQKEGVQLKSSCFDSVIKIIGEDSAYAKEFANGILTHTFLDVQDYHRYHFPVSGTVMEARTILADDAVGGIIHWNEALNKYTLDDTTPGWQSIETRACVIIDTAKYGLVAVLPIGMSQVSSVNFESSVKVGETVKKGDPLGYFLFGGSDIVMIFQQKAGFELTAKESASDSYSHILMGEAYGRMNGADK